MPSRGPSWKLFQVRVGFPAGSQSAEMDSEQQPLYKSGAWTPIAVDIMVGPPGLKGTEGRIEIVVETADADDVATQYIVSESLPELGPGGTFTVNTYTKPASRQLRHQRHASARQPAARPTVQTAVPGRPRRAARILFDDRFPDGRPAASLADGEKTNPNRTENAAYLDRIHQLPNQWFGYDGVDLVILASSKRNDFLLDFVSPRQARRREALAEWVQRGGHLLISVGKNQDVFAQVPEIQAMLPVEITKVDLVRELILGFDGQGGLIAGGKRPPIELARMVPKPGRSYRVLLRRNADDVNDNDAPRGEPLIVQAPYGLGRVTVVGFDLDQKPFADWEKQSRPGNGCWPSPGRAEQKRQRRERRHAADGHVRLFQWQPGNTRPDAESPGKLRGSPGHLLHLGGSSS